MTSTARFDRLNDSGLEGSDVEPKTVAQHAQSKGFKLKMRYCMSRFNVHKPWILHLVNQYLKIKYYFTTPF